MSRFIYTATLLSVLIIAAPAQGANLREKPDWYWGISGGVAFLQDSDLSGGSTGKIKFDNGGLGTLALGYTPDADIPVLANMRFEAEVGYHYNSIHNVTLTGGAPVASGTRARSLSYMGNAYYDFHNSSNVTPYLGAGIGGAQVKLGRTSGAGNTDGDDTVMAYQFMTGLYYTPPGIPTTQWSLGYRYFVEDSPEFGSPTGTIKLDDLSAHTLEVGARFRF